MRLLVLTTDTLHHAHFVRELARDQKDLHVFNETRGLKPPFETAHPFEQTREAYERDLWFSGRHASVGDFAEMREFASMNEAGAVDAVQALAPDLVVVFGTGRLAPGLVGACEDAIFNLHGGDPQEYRGLDSHLWAIYHGDFPGLKTCLHRLDSELDNGDIVGVRPVPLQPGAGLETLRSANTGVCLQLVREMLDKFGQTGMVRASPQRGRGRYYSFMPAVLKEICVTRFARHTGRLA